MFLVLFVLFVRANKDSTKTFLVLYYSLFNDSASNISGTSHKDNNCWNTNN